jgi:2-hydroxychromene-2-carboxylate isomerase
MGELIHLTARRTRRDGRRPNAPPLFFFDVSDPLSYLMAEQVERSLGDVQWVAVDGTALRDGAAEQAGLRADVEARARALRLPLVWPDTFPASTPCALRAAAFACEIGAGPQFVLAASRLAFCGGFDLEDPEVLTEAAAAAGVPLASCLDAAGDRWRDDELAETADVLRAHDIFEPPAITIGERWFAGEGALEQAGAVAAEPQSTRARRDEPQLTRASRRAEPQLTRASRRAEPGWNRGPLAPVG